MKTTIVLICLLALPILFSGCTQAPQQPNNPAVLTQDENLDLSNDLDDLSQLQDSLNDTALDDSGIDENSFS